MFYTPQALLRQHSEEAAGALEACATVDEMYCVLDYYNQAVPTADQVPGLLKLSVQ